MGVGGGLAYLPVRNDQFALSTADRHHGVYALQADLYRLAHPLPGDHAGRNLFD